jgi:hypothetical protein
MVEVEVLTLANPPEKVQFEEMGQNCCQLWPLFRY